MKVRNLTPHQIVVRSLGGEDLVFPPDPDGPVRVESSPGGPINRGEDFWGTCGLCGGCRHEELIEAGEAHDACDCLHLPLYREPVWGDVVGLPYPESGVILIVSALVAAQCAGREDVYSPGTGPNDGAIRSKDGQIVAVTRLVQSPQMVEETASAYCADAVEPHLKPTNERGES